MPCSAVLVVYICKTATIIRTNVIYRTNPLHQQAAKNYISPAVNTSAPAACNFGEQISDFVLVTLWIYYIILRPQNSFTTCEKNGTLGRSAEVAHFRRTQSGECECVWYVIINTIVLFRKSRAPWDNNYSGWFVYTPKFYLQQWECTQCCTIISVL